MSSVWFIRQAGKIYGPFDASRMKKLAKAGKILRDSGVSRQQDGPWVQASHVKGLFIHTVCKSEEDAAPPQENWNPLELVEAATAMASTWRGWFRKKRPFKPPIEDAAETTQWFYRVSNEGGGSIKGPCTAEDMEALVKQGVVRASTLVLQQGATRWETAFSAGLFLDDPRQVAADRDSGSPEDDADREEILWDGRASHHANYTTYLLCALASPFVFPAIWGVRKYVARDCVRYQITSRRVRVKHSEDGARYRDIPLTRVRDASLVSPPCLQTTHLCNIELFGEESGKPLLVLEGVPLAESALVISLCEAAAHRHIPILAKESLLADARAQEKELLRRAELRHKQEVMNLQAQLSLARQPSFFIPPPPRTRKPQPISSLITVLFGPSKRKVRVKGHYRGGRWIKAHDRVIKA